MALSGLSVLNRNNVCTNKCANLHLNLQDLSNGFAFLSYSEAVGDIGRTKRLSLPKSKIKVEIRYLAQCLVINNSNQLTLALNYLMESRKPERIEGMTKTIESTSNPHPNR